FVEDTVTAAQNGALPEVVSETDARREILVVSIEELRPTLAARTVAAKYVRSRETSRARVWNRRIHVRQAAKGVGGRRLEFVSKPEVQRELRRQLIRVIYEPAVILNRPPGRESRK